MKFDRPIGQAAARARFLRGMADIDAQERQIAELWVAQHGGDVEEVYACGKAIADAEFARLMKMHGDRLETVRRANMLTLAPKGTLLQ